jgi:hypothetical protein
MEHQAGKTEQISMEDFVESATRAVLRALVASGLNPQPLPPEETPGNELNPQPEPPGREAAPLNPQPLPPFDITVGIILSSGEQVTVLRGSKI